MSQDIVSNPGAVRGALGCIGRMHTNLEADASGITCIQSLALKFDEAPAHQCTIELRGKFVYSISRT